MNSVQRAMRVFDPSLATDVGTFIHFIANRNPPGAPSYRSSFSDFNKFRGSGGWPPVLSAQQEARS